MENKQFTISVNLTKYWIQFQKWLKKKLQNKQDITQYWIKFQQWLKTQIKL